MRILVISYHHNDENSVGSLRTRSMERLLPEHGFEVYILTSGVHKEQAKFFEKTFSIKRYKYSGEWKIIEYVNRMWSYFSQIVSCYNKQSYWVSTAICHLEEILKISKPDVVFCTYPPVGALKLGLEISDRYSLPLVADFRDAFLEEPLEPGLNNETSCKYLHYKNLYNKILNQSKLITAASSAIAESFRISNDKVPVRTIYNSYNSSENPEAANCFDRNLINILHTGRISASERGTSILGFASGLKKALTTSPDLKKKIRIHFVGHLTYAEKNILRPFVHSGIVKKWGVVKRCDALAMQAAADILLLITKPNAKNAISGKLIEYMRLRKPILSLTSGSEAESIMLKTGLGFIVPPDNPDAIADVILKTGCGATQQTLNINENEIARYKDAFVIKELAELLHMIVRHDCKNNEYLVS